MRSTISLGVPAGASKPAQRRTFKSGKPDSASVGTVGAGRLVQIAQVLGMPIDALLQGLNAPSRKTTQADDPFVLLSNGAAVRLAQAFAQISDRQIRNALVSLAEGIAAGRRRPDKSAA